MIDDRIDDAEKHGWSERWSLYANERTWDVIDALFAVAEESGKTLAQVALNWVMNRPGVTAPIIGVRSMSNLEENLGASGWSLTDDQMQKLTRASDVPLPYPHSFEG